MPTPQEAAVPLVAASLSYDGFFVRLRKINYIQQALSVLVAMGCCMRSRYFFFPATESASLDHFSSHGLLDDGVTVLIFIVFIAAAAEVVMWLGHMWLVRPSGRKLPFWCLLPSISLQRWLNRPSSSKYINAFTALMMLLLVVGVVQSGLNVLTGGGLLPTAAEQSLTALLLQSLVPECVLHGNHLQTITIVALGVFFIASLLDGWRFLFSVYWLASLLCVARIPQANGDDSQDNSRNRAIALCMTGLRIVFSTLYFWAGVFKVISPDFYTSTARTVFAPIFASLHRLFRRPFPLKEKREPTENGNLDTVDVLSADFCENSSTKPFARFVSFMAVFLEALLGVAVFFQEPMIAYLESITTITDLQGGLRHHRWWYETAIMMFDLGMHGYILIGIGYRHGIHTFRSWNCMCMAITCLVVSMSQYSKSSQSHTAATFASEVTSLLQDTFFDPINLLLVVFLNYFPIKMLLGASEFASLSHAWFVTEAVERSTLIFAYPSTASMFPTAENAHPVPMFRDDSIHTAAAFLEQHVVEPRIQRGCHQAAKGGGAMLSSCRGYVELLHKLNIRLPNDLQQRCYDCHNLSVETSKEAARLQQDVVDFTYEHVACIGGEWVDLCFSYFGGVSLEVDCCREGFGAGPLGFWKAVKDGIVFPEGKERRSFKMLRLREGHTAFFREKQISVDEI